MNFSKKFSFLMKKHIPTGDEVLNLFEIEVSFFKKPSKKRSTVPLLLSNEHHYHRESYQHYHICFTHFMFLVCFILFCYTLQPSENQRYSHEGKERDQRHQMGFILPLPQVSKLMIKDIRSRILQAFSNWDSVQLQIQDYNTQKIIVWIKFQELKSKFFIPWKEHIHVLEILYLSLQMII